MIREANKFDIPEIIDLLKQVNLIHHQGRPDIFNIGTKYTKEELEQLIDDEQKPIYVFIDNKILGYAFCIIKEIKDDNILVNRRELYIDDLCVLESNRGNHIGTSLFSYVKEKAIELNCDSITLNVWSFNEGAMAFYQKMGMKPLKTVMEYPIKK